MIYFVTLKLALEFPVHENFYSSFPRKNRQHHICNLRFQNDLQLAQISILKRDGTHLLPSPECIVDVG